MKNIWTIMKKEFSRFFKDRRLVLTLILPGVLIYLIYSFLGQGIFEKIGGTDENYVYQIYTVDMPEEFALPFEVSPNISLKELTPEEAEAAKSDVENQEKDLLAIFPEGFYDDYLAVKNGESASVPQFTLYYNSVRTESAAAYQLFSAVLDEAFQQKTNGWFSVANPDTADLATEKDITGMIFSMIAPMLLLMFLFSGCMAVAPESIAGEKERGTLATMLVTPVKRSHIAIGKVLSLSALSLLSGICSFIGLILSLPKLMGGVDSLGAASYSFGSYVMLLGIILSSVLVIVSLISVVSASAKSVKEASNMVGPLMLIVMILGVSTMFSSGEAGAFWWYLIPLYNSARAMSCIFGFASLHTMLANVLVTIGANFAAAVLLAVLLTKMFDSEKIMFNK